MIQIKRYLLPFLIYLSLVAYLANALFEGQGPEVRPASGQVITSFSLPLLRDPNKTFESKDLIHQVSILNVWASWCPACRQEHPYLMELAASQSIPVYGLNLKDNREDALKLLAELGNPYVASGFDKNGEVARNLGVHGTPTTFLIDSQGVILFKHSSVLTPAVWASGFLPRTTVRH